MLQQLIYWLLKDYDYKVEGLSSEENESLLNLLSSVDNTSFELAKMYITDKKEFKKPIFRLIESLRKPKKNSLWNKIAGRCQIKYGWLSVVFSKYKNTNEIYNYKIQHGTKMVGFVEKETRYLSNVVHLLKL
jgi:hypothetical protein